jgi:hypothetical protein
MDKDTVIGAVKYVVNSLKQPHSVIIVVSGRPDTY